MPKTWERTLQRWVEARLVDAATAARVREFEADRERRGGRRWPVLLAWVFGGMLLCAGVLLFVAAHWDRLSPWNRFALVLLMVGVFHVAAACLRERLGLLAQVLHAVGTVALGGGIFLAGQIFNIEEHWPGAFMLWAAGAWIAWLLLRDRIQAVLAAVLTPIWLAGEWMVATEHMTGGDVVPAEGLWLLALTYLTTRLPGREGPVRHDLAWIGGLAIIPLTFWVIFSGERFASSGDPVPAGLLAAGWIFAYAAPLALAYALRGRAVWPLLIAALWLRLLGATAARVTWSTETAVDWREIGMYALCGLGSALLAWWGVAEARRERINLGVAGFGLTVIFFYFASVMDKLGRSLSLITLGLLLLVGGYALERARRRLLAKLPQAAP
jgi:hypothetical protein